MITPPEGGPRKATKKAKPRPAVVPRPPRSAPATVRYGNSQSLADMAERLAREAMAPDKSSLELQRKQSAAQAQANAATQQAMLAIAQKYLSPLAGQIQGGFNTAADAQAGFGKGYAIGQQLATQGNADTANAVMQSIGAPEGQQISGDVAQAAADVLNATGGQIPADMFRGQGEGYAQAAAAYPKMADARYQDAISRIMGSAYTADQDYAQRLADLEAQFPDLSMKYLLQLEDAAYQHQRDAKNQATTLYNAGLLSQRDLARSLGLPNWDKYPDTTKDSGKTEAQTRLTFKVAADGTLVGLDPFTGKIVSKTTGFGKPVGAPEPPQTVYGPDGLYVWQQTKTGWQMVPVGPRKPVKGPAAQKPHYYQAPDGSEHIYTPGVGDQQVGPAAVPKSAVKPPSAATIRRGWEAITDSYYHAPGSSKRLSDADIQKQLDVANAARKTWTDEHPDKPRPPITLDMLPRMSAAQLRGLGIEGTRRDPQDVYLELVHFGIPARRAWGMVRKYYQEWGKGYFKGKGSATGQVAVKGTVPRSRGAQYIVAEAEKWLGTPYSWGGGGPGGPSYGTGRGANTKGFDCSAFVQYLYAKYGVNLPRTTYDQIKSGYSVKGQTYQPGDLLFFGTSSDPHHVGMYIGGGKFIESPYTGSHIKITPLTSRRDIVDVRRIFA